MNLLKYTLLSLFSITALVAQDFRPNLVAQDELRVKEDLRLIKLTGALNAEQYKNSEFFKGLTPAQKEQLTQGFIEGLKKDHAPTVTKPEQEALANLNENVISRAREAYKEEWTPVIKELIKNLGPNYKEVSPGIYTKVVKKGETLLNYDKVEHKITISNPINNQVLFNTPDFVSLPGDKLPVYMVQLFSQIGSGGSGEAYVLINEVTPVGKPLVIHVVTSTASTDDPKTVNKSQ